jgi:ABC-type branched-subunit amino acid transport system ATPase component
MEGKVKVVYELFPCLHQMREKKGYEPTFVLLVEGR